MELNSEVQTDIQKPRQFRWKRAEELLQDFADNSTLHGLKYMSEKGRSLVEKIFWVVTFLVSISLCAVLIQNVWVKWQTSPVIVALSEHLVSVGEVPFPSVTICPQIKAKRSVYNFTHETIEMIKKMKNTQNGIAYDLHDDNKFEDVGLVCWIEPLLLQQNARNLSDATVFRNIIEVSPTMDDIFRSCRWREQSVACEDIFSPVLTAEGLCYTMNTIAANEIFRKESVQQDYYYLNSTKPNKNWSLKDGYTSMEDDDNVYPRRGRGNGAWPDMMVILREQPVDHDGLCYGINHGYKVFLQHPADLPQSSLYFYAALPGQLSSLALKFSIMNTSRSLIDYSPEIRQCYFPEERQLKYFRTYTPMNCRLECLSEYTFESCGCVWFHMPHNTSSAICRELKRSCVIHALERFAVEEGKTNSKVERCQCLPSCIGIQYDAEILKTKFDIHSYLDALKIIYPEWYVNKTDEDEGYTFTNIELYYKESRYVSMRRSELFGLTDFLANCGGLLGLFLGFSFLSFVEIFYFLTVRLACTLRRDRVLK